MRDFTKLPSYREVQAKKAAALAIRTAYADRSAWRPSAEAVAADRRAPTRQLTGSRPPCVSFADEEVSPSIAEAAEVVKADAEGWIKNDRRTPLPPVGKLWIRCRDGYESLEQSSCIPVFWWTHTGSNRGDDIVAYRVID